MTSNAQENEEEEISTTVKFNVGGKLYEVSKSLLEGYPDTTLAQEISSSAPIFIDRDPDRFAFCLDYMRDNGTVYLPETVSKSAFLKELEFLGFVDIDETKICDEKSHQNCIYRFDQITEATKSRIASMEQDVDTTREQINKLESHIRRRREEIKLEKFALRCRATSVESTAKQFVVDYGNEEGLVDLHRNQYFIECCDKLALVVVRGGASSRSYNATHVYLRQKTNSEAKK